MGGKGNTSKATCLCTVSKGPQANCQGSQWHTVEGPHHCHCQVGVGIKHRAELDYQPGSYPLGAGLRDLLTEGW